ncbi:MAG: choice-of-anchor Q domain-containing protein [Dehalococcoidia bacterium]|nr:choice-of-anchor Q domain-containing protein [Dehalococcoidia bacterium]MDD5493206.1 choice-of-anchor Q domain-containing protein [Dehalococcoidia bacterium]
MSVISRALHFLLIGLLVFPFIVSLVAVTPARADVDLDSMFIPRYPSDNRTPRYSMPSIPGFDVSGGRFQTNSVPPMLLPMPHHTTSPGSMILGAGSLADVYVNGTTGSDNYTGSSPTVQAGDVGPKKTLQAGLNEADDYGTVHVAAGTYRENLTVDNISVYLEGAGARDTIIDGGSIGPVVQVNGDSLDIVIDGFTIRNGNGVSAGGIITDWDCYLYIWDSAIINNTGDVAGGIYCEEGYLEVVQSLVAGNIAGEFGGGILANDSEVLLQSSTISGNSLAPGGHWGGGICCWDSITYMFDVTLAFNSATGDPTSAGGGLASVFCDWLIYNTIIANNSASTAGTNNGHFFSPADDIVLDAYSIDSENSTRLSDPTSQVNTDPVLGPLQNNGGPTDTHAITSDSPAFERGGSPLLLDEDQRWVIKPQGAYSDVGAYELVLTANASTGGSGAGTVVFSTDTGGLAHLTTLTPVLCSGIFEQGISFPYGLFSFQVVGIPIGSSVKVTIRLPQVVPANLQYWKNSGMCIWINYTSQVSFTPGDNVIVLTLTDGGSGDLDGVADGRIIDPGGPAWSAVRSAMRQVQSPASSSSSVAPPQQPVTLPNLLIQSASLSASTVHPGEPVTVTAVVANKGNANGSRKVVLIVNGEEEAAEGVTVNGGGTTTVTFDLYRDQPGTYKVYVGNNYAGEFVVSQYVDPELVLLISLAMLLAAFILGLVMIYRRQNAGY